MNASLSTYVLKEADPKQIGAANGLISTFAFAGAAIVLMLANAVMVVKAKSALTALAAHLPTALSTTQLQALFQVTRGLEPITLLQQHFDSAQLDNAHRLVQQALTHGYTSAMIFLGCIGIGVMLVSLLIGKQNTVKY